MVNSDGPASGLLKEQGATPPQIWSLHDPQRSLQDQRGIARPLQSDRQLQHQSQSDRPIHDLQNQVDRHVQEPRAHSWLTSQRDAHEDPISLQNSGGHIHHVPSQEPHHMQGKEHCDQLLHNLSFLVKIAKRLNLLNNVLCSYRR